MFVCIPAPRNLARRSPRKIHKERHQAKAAATINQSLSYASLLQQTLRVAAPDIATLNIIISNINGATNDTMEDACHQTKSPATTQRMGTSWDAVFGTNGMQHPASPAETIFHVLVVSCSSMFQQTLRVTATAQLELLRHGRAHRQAKIRSVNIIGAV